MFWDTFGVDNELENKLADPNVSLKIIVQDSHCFQEIRNSNANLMNFLKREDVFRELVKAIILPKESDETFEKEKYKFVHQCCETICLAANDFYKEIIKYEDLLNQLLNFLKNQMGNLNHLIVSFYSKIIICFLSVENGAFLEYLEQSRFLENCFENLEFCSIFELLCTIPNCLSLPEYRLRVKQWYTNKSFMNLLFELFSIEQPTEIHENVAAIWVEFVKGLRETQINNEEMNDPLFETIHSPEMIKNLLNIMFPLNKSDESLSLIANGTTILNAFLETNYCIKNSPAFFLQQETQHNMGGTNLDYFHGDEIIQQHLIDSNRMVEKLCAEKSNKIVSFILLAIRKNPDEFYGDALVGCLQLLLNLLNTNFAPTHLEILSTFSCVETHFKKFFDFIISNSTFSIFNSYITNIILYILYSSTIGEKSLTTFLIKDFNLTQFIRNSVKLADNNLENQKFTLKRFNNCKGFFLNLANRLSIAQTNSQQADFIETLIRSLPDYDEWIEFVDTTVKNFNDNNRFDKILSNTTRSNNKIEIDEIKDLPFTMESVPDEFRGVHLDSLIFPLSQNHDNLNMEVEDKPHLGTFFDDNIIETNFEETTSANKDSFEKLSTEERFNKIEENDEASNFSPPLSAIEKDEAINISSYPLANSVNPTEIVIEIEKDEKKFP